MHATLQEFFPNLQREVYVWKPIQQSILVDGGLGWGKSQVKFSKNTVGINFYFIVDLAVVDYISIQEFISPYCLPALSPIQISWIPSAYYFNKDTT